MVDTSLPQGASRRLEKTIKHLSAGVLTVGAPVSVYGFGPFRLDAEQLLLAVDGVPVALGPRVVETLNS